MTFAAIILSAAKTAKVSGSLLLAICTHESGLTNAMVLHGGNSPTYGVCQVKYETAHMIGFKGKPLDLMDPSTNAKWAAKYVSYQVGRYGSSDWCKLAAAYNAGTYNPSSKVLGCPKNLKYVKAVKSKLKREFHSRMACGGK
jgi:soluble lytic murein transglycosylase-like protein